MNCACKGTKKRTKYKRKPHVFLLKCQAGALSLHIYLIEEDKQADKRILKLSRLNVAYNWLFLYFCSVIKNNNPSPVRYDIVCNL